MLAVLGYIDLALKVVIAVNFTYFTYEYICCKRFYSKFKSLYTEMNDLKTIINNDPALASPATAVTTNYKDRLCGVVSIAATPKNIWVKNTPSKKSNLFARRTKRNCSSVTKLNSAEKW